MDCPRCNSKNTQVYKPLKFQSIDYLTGLAAVYRHQWCRDCYQHFQTIETSISIRQVEMSDKVAQSYDIKNETQRKRERVTADEEVYYTIEVIKEVYSFDKSSCKAVGKEYL